MNRNAERDLMDLLRKTRPLLDVDHAKPVSDKQFLAAAVAWMTYAGRYGIRKIKRSQPKQLGKTKA